eukprot:6491516-Amphidinium_carterae.2
MHSQLVAQHVLVDPNFWAVAPLGCFHVAGAECSRKVFPRYNPKRSIIAKYSCVLSRSSRCGSENP